MNKTIDKEEKERVNELLEPFLNKKTDEIFAEFDKIIIKESKSKTIEDKIKYLRELKNISYFTRSKSKEEDYRFLIRTCINDTNEVEEELNIFNSQEKLAEMFEIGKKKGKKLQS